MKTEHQEQIERCANFVRNNPAKWKKIHTEFINAIYAKHEEIKGKLLKMPDGKEKLEKIRQLKNIEMFKT